MSVTIELPEEVLGRLQAEATRRGISVDEVIAELANALPAGHAPERVGHRFSFTGVAASGDGTLSETQVGSSLSISGVGASGGRHGWARDADEALAQGFGRD